MEKTMTLNQIRYFYTIAKYQNFHHAAEELNVSQPSLSRSMSALEEEFDIMLFEKQGRNVVLTKYGRLFIEYAARILEEVNTAEQKMKQLSGTGGHIDIAYVYPLANQYIPHMVRQFLNIPMNKNVTFNFTQAITADLITGLKNNKHDVIFGAYVKNEPDITFVPIIRQEMVVLVPPGHPLADKDTVSLTILNDYPVIGYDHVSGMGMETRAIYKKYRLHPQITIECPDENSIAALVAEDFGIALVANVDTLPSIPVRILHLEEENLYHGVYMAYRTDRYRISATNRFIRFIKKEGVISN